MSATGLTRHTASKVRQLEDEILAHVEVHNVEDTDNLQDRDTHGSTGPALVLNTAAQGELTKGDVHRAKLQGIPDDDTPLSINAKEVIKELS